MSNQTEVKGLDEQLKSNTINILILVTRDGRINITHALARQISPVLDGFIDNWNKDNNEFYLNFSSKEVNDLLDTYNAKGTLKDYLLCDVPKKKLTLLDILDNFDILNKIIQIRIVEDKWTYTNMNNWQLDKSYSIYVFISDKYQHWIFGFEKYSKEYKMGLCIDKYCHDKNFSKIIFTVPTEYQKIFIDKIGQDIKLYMIGLFKAYPHLLKSYFD